MIHMRNKVIVLGALLVTASIGAANAQVVNIGDSAAGSQAADRITGTETWTANNTYVLQDQIFVMPGATLTIEAGTVVQSTPALQGSLAVTNGGQIFVNGTAAEPVIMTSSEDIATWDVDGTHPTGGDPRTGVHRYGDSDGGPNENIGALEWGNLTIMGDAIISENATGGNTAVPTASNVADMEGLTVPSGQPASIIQYGGGNDDDDSGSISYLSIRYGGKVIGLANELNGLSLGGIGRGTDINYVEIFNNVDDGIEIWGGTVNLKYVNIWNVGDDSFDVDQGWRGKTQHGLIVQGGSINDDQGSGMGDNAFEVDGAEDSDWQPVTTAAVYNYTVIGQPFSPGGSDGMTTWRDNARVQYRNCIFMDSPDDLVRFDDVDGDGANGYGHNGTLSWQQTWDTGADTLPTVNASAVAGFTPAELYTAQSLEYDGANVGRLAEIRDSVVFNVSDTSATGLTGIDLFVTNYDNVAATNMPITSLTRLGSNVTYDSGAHTWQPVTAIDPFPANDALTSVDTAPNDGFFDQANYRGGFEPVGSKGVADSNWLLRWTAVDAFGLLASSADVDFSSVDGWMFH